MKVYGLIPNFVPVRETYSQVIVSYNMVAEPDGKHATWHEVYFNKRQVERPTLEQIKEAVITDINERVKERIIGGFVWNGKPVWLSEYNQLNFAQGVAPVTLRIGEEADGYPVYHYFETAKQLKAFSDACSLWKQQCLQEGWAEKDSIDWSQYDPA